MCLHLTRLDRSSGWEEGGGGALGSEVSHQEERWAGRAQRVPCSGPGLVEDGDGRGESDELPPFPSLGRNLHLFTWNIVLVSLSVSIYRGMLADVPDPGL